MVQLCYSRIIAGVSVTSHESSRKLCRIRTMFLKSFESWLNRGVMLFVFCCHRTPTITIDLVILTPDIRRM